MRRKSVAECVSRLSCVILHWFIGRGYLEASLIFSEIVCSFVRFSEILPSLVQFFRNQLSLVESPVERGVLLFGVCLDSKNFEVLKNREDSSDFDNSWTVWIVMIRSIVWDTLFCPRVVLGSSKGRPQLVRPDWQGNAELTGKESPKNFAKTLKKLSVGRFFDEKQKY